MEDSFSRILEEVNEKNIPKYPLTLINVKPTAPSPVVHEEHNTSMWLDAVPGKAYYNRVEIFYKRLHLDQILEEDVVIRNTKPMTAQEVLDMINAQYNLFITPADVEAFAVPTVVRGEQKTITLVATADSYGFLGSLEVTLDNNKILLTSVVGNRILPVLGHPVDLNLGKRSARMLTWGIDFTSLFEKFNPTGVGGTMADHAGMLAACSLLGIPSFNNGSLTLSPTGSVEGANTAFAMVGVMKKVVSPSMLGDLYFHYNILDN